VRDGEYQTGIQAFARAHHQRLNAMYSAFLSVSLSAASRDPDDIAKLQQCVRDLAVQTGWKADEVHHVAGALRYTQSAFLRQWALKFIAYQHGAAYTSGDHELTDWVALGRLVDKFLDTASGGRPAEKSGPGSDTAKLGRARQKQLIRRMKDDGALVAQGSKRATHRLHR